MDYITYNKEEHQRYKELIEKIENSEGEEKKDLFIDLYSSLYAHHHAEEEIFYPEILDAITDANEEEKKQVVMERVEEHSLLHYQFSVVGKTFAETPSWNAKFSVLKELVEYHMREEENTFSRTAKKYLTEDKIEELVEPIKSLYEQLKAEKVHELNSLN